MAKQTSFQRGVTDRARARVLIFWLPLINGFWKKIIEKIFFCEMELDIL